MTRSTVKWVAGLVAGVLVSSMVTFPSFAHAEKKMDLAAQWQRAQRIHKLNQAKHDVGQAKEMVRTSATQMMMRSLAVDTTTTDATQVQYDGIAKPYQTEQYVFTVTGTGPLQVDATLPPDSAVTYDLLSWDTQDSYTSYINSANNLPTGKYVFVVYSQNDQSSTYSFKLSGVTFQGTPDTQLPQLTVDNPTDHDLRLQPGTTSVNASGTTDGEMASVTMDGQTPIALSTGSFSQSLSLHLRWNYASFVAANSSGNAVSEDFSLTVPGVERIAGADRYEVSANVSKQIPIQSSTIVIARGDLFADALSGAPLAAIEGAPLLLTKPTVLPDSIKAEIQRRRPDHAIILGGTGAVSTGVENTLKSLGITTERIAGADRYAVSAQIADRIMAELPAGQLPDTAVVADGANFPDALAVSSAASQMTMPILLVKPTAIPASISTAIHANINLQNFIIVGGTGAVSTAVENQLFSYRGGVVDRVSGQNRYETAVGTAEEFALSLDPDNAIVVRGDNFPDALSGGVFGAGLGAPILLTPPTSLHAAVSSYLQGSPHQFIDILGGVGAVSTGVENSLLGLVQ